LHQRCKCQNDDFTPCINDANTKKQNLPITIKSKTNEKGKNQFAQPAKRRALRVLHRRSGVCETTAKQFMEGGSKKTCPVNSKQFYFFVFHK
jgi:uncharacterized OsmC-like protein